MCLILFAVNPNPVYRLVVAANRDELYARPTEDAQFWVSQPDILAGRDADMGGTWLGVNRRGQFAAVTNFREAPHEPAPPRSRGDLPTGFLASNPDPSSYVKEVSLKGNEYKGFNLVVADQEKCCYFGNRAGPPRELGDGYYGLSNQVLDCDWPKVTEGRAQLKDILAGGSDPVDAMFDLLLSNGDGRDFSNSFIASDIYGTRAATVVLVKTSGEVIFEEQNFGEAGLPLTSNKFRFNCSDGS